MMYYNFKIRLFDAAVEQNAWLRGWVALTGSIILLIIMYLELPQFDVRIARVTLPLSASLMLLEIFILYSMACLSEVLPRLGYSLFFLISFGFGIWSGVPYFQDITWNSECYRTFGCDSVFDVGVRICFVTYSILVISQAIILIYISNIDANSSNHSLD